MSNFSDFLTQPSLSFFSLSDPPPPLPHLSIQAPLVNATNFYFAGSTDALAMVMLGMGALMVVPIILNDKRQQQQQQQKQEGGGGKATTYTEVYVTETALV